MQIVPTLNFEGNCREAIHMYKRAFNGKINCLITYGEANDPEYNPVLRDNQKEYIYHSELVLNNQKIIMSDHVILNFKRAIQISLPLCMIRKKKFNRHMKL